MTRFLVSATLILASPMATAECEQSMFAGGDGSPINPWQVSEPVHLDNVRHCLDDHFIQLDNIDLDIAPYNEGSGWVPIGEFDTPFTGSYNGLWLQIDGLFIEAADSNPQGLFGTVENALIKRVWLRHIDVQSSIQAPVGGLVGRMNEETVIFDCSIHGQLQAMRQYGGVVGLVAGDGRIERCRAEVETSSASVEVDTDGAGGLAGSLLGGEIIDSYARGSVTGDLQVGGLVGNLVEATVRRSYSTGLVDGETDVGGLIGSTAGVVTVTDSFWDTETSQFEISAGGTGKTTAEMTDSATFTDTDTEGLDEPWNFDGLWTFRSNANDDYPFLTWSQVTTVVGDNGRIEPDGNHLVSFEDTISFRLIPDDEHEIGEVSGCDGHLEGNIYTTGPIVENCTVEISFELLECNSSLFDGGTGASDDPWQIATAEQLDNVRQCAVAGHYFEQTADINLDIEPFNQGAGWIPIEASTGEFSGSFFEGHYDGNGHTIANLFIENATAYGLFGSLEHDTSITNLRITNVQISGTTQAAALTPRTRETTLIENVHVTGQISSSAGADTAGLVSHHSGSITLSSCHCTIEGQLKSGGLVGDNQNGTVERSLFIGEVTGTSETGGLVGNHNGGLIRQSYAEAMVTANAFTGGLAGMAQGAIEDSYFRGSVFGGNYTGGAVGTAANLTMRDVFSAALVSTTDQAEDIGGLIGSRVEESTTVEGAFWDMEVSGQTASAGGTGKTTADMIDIATFTDTDTEGLDESWDFDETWTIDPEINGGYPYLSNNLPPERLDQIFRSRFEQ